MILVDTSVWIDHLRSPEKRLLELLQDGTVMTHTLVIEEVACGHLKRRDEVLSLLHALPAAPVATHLEVLALVSNKTLYGVGLGAIDVHLIASTLLAGALLWTKDEALARESNRLNVHIK
jgi:predicted nucleic acid-binding protein